MKSESYWAMFGTLLLMFVRPLKRWLNRLRRLDVSYQTGNDGSRINVTTLNTNPENEKDN